MTKMLRHQLVRIQSAAWQKILCANWDAEARFCIEHWSQHNLPLVATRLTAVVADNDSVALGLPTPIKWGRRRLALHVPKAQLASKSTFPGLCDVIERLLPNQHTGLSRLAENLSRCASEVVVYGSHGWECLSGLVYTHAYSDLDLLVRVHCTEQADQAAALLAGFPSIQLRLDGELQLGAHGEVAWREWAKWRSGCTSSVLVKRVQGISLLRHESDLPNFDSLGALA